MSYELAYFTSVTLPNAELAAIREQYCAWILGRWPGYDRMRQQRVEIGIDPRWQPKDIRATKKAHGADDYELESREATDLWLLRYRHRDRDDPAILLQHQVRLRQQSTTVIVEHGIRRSAPLEILRPLRRSPRPRIVDDLLKAHPAARPLNQTLPVTRLGAEDVDGFVGNLLFDAGSVPWVVVSPDEALTKPLINPEDLTQWLRGIAAVALLETAEATWCLTNALRQRGLGDEFRCFGGAVRSYDSSRGANRLPFLMPAQLLSIAEDQRSSLAGGDLARRLAGRSIPASFFSFIEDEDQHERARSIEKLRNQLTQGSTSLEEVKRQAVYLEGVISSTDDEIRQLKSDNADLERAVEAAKMARDEVMQKLDDDTRRLVAQIATLRGENQDLRDKLRIDQLSPDLRAKVATAFKSDPSPIDTVELIERVHGDRIVFLPSAKASARKASVFQRPRKVAELLWTLATDYYDALANGLGDAEARKFFGRDFAAKDKENLSTRGAKLRTFEWKGVPHLMEAHLRDGNKVSDAECLRIHFEWFPEDEKIVVGHCGGHLDF